MGTVNLTAPQSYAQQLAQAAYQQKMAEALQAQSDAPIDIQSYKGIQAPIPWTAVLAKALQGFGGAYMQKRALEGQAGAEASDRASYLSKYANDTGSTDATPAGPGAMDAMSAPNAPPENAGSQLASVLAMGGAAPSDAGPPPPAPMPPPVADNPMNPQAASQNAGLAQAIQGNAPPPQATAPPSAPPMPQPPQALQGNAPPPQATPPSDASPPAPTPQAVPQAVQPTAPASPNPYDALMKKSQNRINFLQRGLNDPSLSKTSLGYVANDLTNERKKYDEMNIKSLEYNAKIAEKGQTASSSKAAINGLPNLTDDEKTSFILQADADPTGALQRASSVSTTVTNENRHALIPAGPEELAGYPPGTIARMDPVTHELKNVYNPSADLMAIANNKLAQQHLAIAQRELANSEYVPTLSEDARDLAAVTYIATNALPNLGVGIRGTELKTDIINRAGEINKTAGVTPMQAVAARSMRRADTAALTAVTKQADTTAAFGRTVMGHFDQALEQAKAGGVPTNMGPIINNWVQKGSVALGGKEVPPFAVSLLTAADEYAKVLDGSTGAAGASVSSRQAAANLFKAGYNVEQLKPVIESVKGIIATKEKEYTGQRDNIAVRLGAAPPAAAPPSATPPPAATQGLTPEQAQKLPPGTPFITTDGRHLVRH